MKYSMLSFGLGLMVALPSCQLAGHTCRRSEEGPLPRAPEVQAATQHSAREPTANQRPASARLEQGAGALQCWPACWAPAAGRRSSAHLAMLIGELERLEQAQRLVHCGGRRGGGEQQEAGCVSSRGGGVGVPCMPVG